MSEQNVKPVKYRAPSISCNDTHFIPGPIDVYLAEDYDRLASEVTRLAALTPKWRPMETRPLDVSILVYLEKPHQGSHVVAARFGTNVSLVGGYFAFDMPKPLGWMYPPTPPPSKGE